MADSTSTAERDRSAQTLPTTNKVAAYPRPLRKQLFSWTGMVLASLFIAILVGCESGPGEPAPEPIAPPVVVRGNLPVVNPNVEAFPEVAHAHKTHALINIPPTLKGVGLERQADCSLTAFFLSNFNPMTNGFTSTPVPNVEKRLHDEAGLTTTADLFPHGCKDPVNGLAARRSVFLGKAKDGVSLIGANIDVSNIVRAGTLNPVAGTSNATQLAVPNPNLLSSGDLRGSGNQDLLVQSFPPTSTGGSSVFVFLSDGNGGFTPGTTAAQTTTPSTSFTVDDMNGDGKLDLLVTALGPGGVNSSSQLLFYPGKGDGTFGAPVATPIPAAQFFATGDFNNDGKKDVVLGDGTILLGNGDGTFTAAPPSVTFPGNSSGTPVVGDWNGDGKQDLAITDSGAFIHIFIGKGDGTFTQGASYSGIYGADSIQATDIDGDGNQDLLVGLGNGGVYGSDVNSGGLIQPLFGNGDGTFVGAPVYGAHVNQGSVASSGFAVADFTGDGKPDVLAAISSGFPASSGLQLFTGDGKGSFAAGALISGTAPIQVVVADMDGDKKQDAVFLESNGSFPAAYDLAVALGNGDGTFQTKTSVNLVTPPGQGNSSALATGDFNGDGKPDAVVAINTSVYLLMNQGQGMLGAPTTIATEPNPVTSVAIADLNGDGKMDLVLTEGTAISGATPGAVVVLLGNGDGSFKPPVNLTATFSPIAVAIADMNKDGKLDIVVGGISQDFTVGTLSVFLGNGDGTFGAAINTKLNESFLTSLAVGDVDGDGKMDVVLGNCCGRTSTSVAFGDGDGTFSKNINLAIALSSNSVTAADVNGDGRPDILLVQSEPGSVATGFDVLLNLYGTVPTTGPTASTTTLTASASAITAGQSLTLTATVAGPTGNATIPTGLVLFTNDGFPLGTATAPLNTAGVATLILPSLTPGTYSIIANYTGDANFATSSSTAVAVTVAAGPPADFALSLNPTSITITHGQPASTTVTVTPQNGFSQQVNLTCSGLPTNATCGFAPAAVTPAGGAAATSTLTITTDVKVATNAAQSAGLPGSTGGLPVAFGGLGFAVWLLRRRTRGYSRVLLVFALTLTGLGIVACGGSSSSATRTPAGNYIVTVNAAGGGVTHGATYNLTVR